MIDIEEIKHLLPHRYPFLLVDRVVEMELGKSVLALKNVTYNEQYFTGHFPKRSIMPGVLIIEALAQVTGILFFKSQKDSISTKDNATYMLIGMENVRFKKIVCPGDQLFLSVKLISNRHNIWKFMCNATVNNKTVTAPTLLCTQKKYE